MITLPIYWEQEFKTKPNKLHLMGMNWYRNQHYQLKNKAKIYYHSLIENQVLNQPKLNQFKVEYTLYYKNPNSDPSNIVPLMEKYLLDALQEFNIIDNDNAKYHLGSSWTVAGQSKSNPRVEITLKEV
jgi:hypothetical protein